MDDYKPDLRVIWTNNEKIQKEIRLKNKISKVKNGQCKEFEKHIERFEFNDVSSSNFTLFHLLYMVISKIVSMVTIPVFVFLLWWNGVYKTKKAKRREEEEDETINEMFRKDE